MTIASGFYTWTARAERDEPLKGDEKYRLAEYMSRIADIASEGSASIEISYGSHSVTLVIRPQPTEAMRERARARAERATTRGLSGFLARALIFLYGLGAEARRALDDRMAEKYLQEELSGALSALAERIGAALSLSEERGLLLGSRFDS